MNLGAFTTSMTLEEPAIDFAIRIGNVILQGRHADDIADSRPAVTAAAETIATQAQTLLAEG